MGTEGRYRSIIGNVSAASIMPWSYCPYPWAEVLMPMLYFLFVLDAWEGYPYVLKLVTNMGTDGRYRSIYVDLNISPGMSLPWVIFHDPIGHIPGITCWNRCYISYSYWMHEKDIRMYWNWSQIWEALRVGIGASMSTLISRWEWVCRK